MPNRNPNPALSHQKLADLLALIALNDRQAFSELYDLTSTKLFSVIMRILSSGGIAEDCLQECYVKVWNQAQRYRPDLAAPMTWLMTIARNQAIDMLRKERSTLSIDDTDMFDQEIESHLLPENMASDSEAYLRLNDCLETLDPQQRQVITLAYFKGLTHEQLSAHITSPLGSVKTWIRRGLEKLKGCLSHE
jgi:RNA polymerase sigma-70 factor (ECF subfamily)